jgi:hypothetical protein
MADRRPGEKGGVEGEGCVKFCLTTRREDADSINCFDFLVSATGLEPVTY